MNASLAGLGQLLDACNDDDGKVVLIIANDDGGRSVEEHLLERCADRVWRMNVRTGTMSLTSTNPPTKARIFFLQPLASFAAQLLSELIVPLVYHS